MKSFPPAATLLCLTTLFLALNPLSGTGQSAEARDELSQLNTAPSDKETEQQYWTDLMKSKEGFTADAERIPDWQARLELARVLGYQNKYDEALKHYRRILENKPEQKRLKIEMAHLYYFKGNSDKAHKLLRQFDHKVLVEAGPKNLALAAECMASAGKYDTAIALYKAYLDKYAAKAPVLFKYAQVLSWTEKYDQSLQQYRKLLDKHPDNKQVRRHYARVLMWSGQHDKAAKELKKTLNNTE